MPAHTSSPASARPRSPSLNRSGLIPRILALAGLLLIVALLPEALLAQQEVPARRMRDFWHVFIAYGIAWLILFGWVVAIFRRLGRVEARLEREGGLPGG